jgi:2-C-methyl-D-erythritol 4-phosphate cytidylyltransferase
MNKYCIIVAGGSGTRMKSAIPKQFLELGDKPVLLHTLQHFINYDPSINIILVLPENEIKTWENIKERFSFTHPVTVTHGGKTRHQSVANGLSLVPNNCIVAVHDAVRPLISKDLLQRCYQEAEKNGSAIPVISVNDSIRQITGEASKQVNRNDFVIVQTPQCFNSSTLKKAFDQPEDASFTDEASVLEKSGTPLHLVEGEKQNLKITNPEDLIIAYAILSHPK